MRIGIAARCACVTLVLWGSSPAAAQEAEVALEVGEPAPVATHPDEGLMIAGGLTMGISYAAGAALGWLFSGSPLALIPLGHWAGVFGGGSEYAGISLLFAEPFTVTELVGLIILLAGAFHHHPVEPAGVAVRAGPGSLEITF